jgi:hypothetical protein
MAKPKNTTSMFSTAAALRIPLWLKLVYTGFMAVLIPVAETSI